MTANSLATPDKRSSAMTSTTAKSLVTSTTNKKKLGMQINQAKAGSRAAGNAGDLSGISPIKYPASRRRVDFNKGPASLSKKKRELTKKEAGSKNRKSVQKGCQTKCTNETSRQSDLKNRSCQDLHGAGTQQRKKFAQMESKVRRHELETKSHKSRIQAMNLQIQEKDRIIRNLESKLPKVLADVSRGLQTRENSKKPWREARNNQGLVGQQLTAKSEECDQLRKQNSRLREDAKLLNNIIRSNQAELDAERTRVARLEEELISLHQKMSSHIQESNSRMEYLQDENEYLYSEIRYQYDALLETEEDIKKIEQFLSNLISNFPTFQEIKREDLSTKAKDLLKEEEKSEFFNNISRDGIVSGNITWPARSRRKWKLPKVTEWNSSDEFENSEDKSQFCNRLENLDFQLEVLLNKLNNTSNKSTLN